MHSFSFFAAAPLDWGLDEPLDEPLAEPLAEPLGEPHCSLRGWA